MFRSNNYQKKNAHFSEVYEGPFLFVDWSRFGIKHQSVID